MRLKVHSLPDIHLSRFVSIRWKVLPRCGLGGSQDKSPGLLPRSGKLVSLATHPGRASNKWHHSPPLGAASIARICEESMETTVAWFRQFVLSPARQGTLRQVPRASTKRPGSREKKRAGICLAIGSQSQGGEQRSIIAARSKRTAEVRHRLKGLDCGADPPTPSGADLLITVYRRSPFSWTRRRVASDFVPNPRAMGFT
jgi:hypothetical protein